MRVIQLQAENIKKISTVDITPTGSMVQITGRNGQGKSSVLDAILYALAGGKALPKQPIRKGQTSAKVRLDLGEYIVTRKFTLTDAGETTTALVVEGPNGARFPQPQTLLDKLMGAIAFDPLLFSRLDAKAQFDLLRQISNLELDLAGIAGQNAKDYEARTDLNRQAKQTRAQAAGITFAVDLPETAPNLSELLEKMSAAVAHNAEIDAEVHRRARGFQLLATDREMLTRMYAEREEAVKRLDAQIATQEQRIAASQKVADNLPPPAVPVDVVQLKGRIDQADLIRRHVENRDRQKVLLTQTAELEAKAEALTQAMKARDEAKAIALAAAKMPIEDISLGDGVVLYKGLPFDQASSAEQLRVSVAIAMSANPKLRVLRIKEGGLLDDLGMTILREMTEAADYQVWIETVHANGPVAVEMVDGTAKSEEAADGKLL